MKRVLLVIGVLVSLSGCGPSRFDRLAEIEHLKSVVADNKVLIESIQTESDLNEERVSILVHHNERYDYEDIPLIYIASLTEDFGIKSHDYDVILVRMKNYPPFLLKVENPALLERLSNFLNDERVIIEVTVENDVLTSFTQTE